MIAFLSARMGDSEERLKDVRRLGAVAGLVV
jgi:hypothetical protein